MSSILNKIDLDMDGKVTQNEIDQRNSILELELREEKAETQKNMAWFSMLSMVLFTIFLFTPLVKPERVDALSDLISVFYIAQAGVVGAYMGVTAWMNKK